MFGSKRLRARWREYGAEYLGAAVVLLVGLSAVTLDFAKDSPIPGWIPNAPLRRLITGAIFAGTGTLVVYSPIGKRSGAHLNPAVTLAFFSLGKIGRGNAIAYVASQVAGALTGAMLALIIWGDWARSVHVGATVPGSGGPAAATIAEIALTFLLVTLILNFVDRMPIAAYTGIAARMLVALLVCIEAPISGTSLNPARSLPPATLTGDFGFIWIYLIAPPLGALFAAGLFARVRTTPTCAKMYHPSTGEDCIFVCDYQAQKPDAERGLVR